jgi:hypothetical protein
MEFFVTGLGGGSTTAAIYQNDVLLLSVTCATSSAVNSIAIGNQNGTTYGVNSKPYFGLGFANLVFTDGQGPAPWNTRLGPVRVTTLSPNADAGGNWNITPGTLTARYQAVDDIFPTDGNGSLDFDNSYISPVAINASQFFTVQGAACYGLILGVNVCLVFRGSSGSTTCNALLLQQSVQTTLGTAVFTGPSGIYQTEQVWVGLSPATGINFTDGEIAGSFWGVSTTSPGLILTQMFLEKIVSLRAVPFNCGQASYSF